MEKKRLSYIDIAKGILILFLLMGHALLFIRNEGIDDGFINGFQRLRLYLWTPYYMPAFFVITGFCSNFDKPFPTFLWQNFKTLKIPAMIFGTFLVLVTMMSHHAFSFQRILHHVSICVFESGLWFLDALFIAKVLYWCIMKISNNRLLLFLSCLSFFFVVVMMYKNNIPPKDFGNICHALMLTVFLFVGQQMKIWQMTSRQKTVYGGLVFILVVVYAIMCEISIPFITNKVSIDWTRVLPFFILSISGSVALIGISHLISDNRWLEYIGRNSLVYYMFNTFALNISVKFLVGFMKMGIPSILVYLLILIVTCLILAIITKFLNTKYLSFSLGKF